MCKYNVVVYGCGHIDYEVREACTAMEVIMQVSRYLTYVLLWSFCRRRCLTERGKLAVVKISIQPVPSAKARFYNPLYLLQSDLH